MLKRCFTINIRYRFSKIQIAESALDSIITRLTGKSNAQGIAALEKQFEKYQCLEDNNICLQDIIYLMVDL